MLATRPKKILIIEDNEDYSDILKIRLEVNGYHAIAVQDGVDGFNIGREKNRISSFWTLPFQRWTVKKITQSVRLIKIWDIKYAE